MVFSQEKLDLNKATLDQLKALPGIGEITAKRIIELRERKGGFQSIEELKEVPGIGDKKLEVLKNYLTVKEEGKNILQKSFNTTNMESSKYENTRVIYMYKDDKGNLHYTQFPELVPEKFRKSLKPIR
ncbi:MAG: ComEA family DNA-binding protein [Caldimicrobium sp.]